VFWNGTYSSTKEGIWKGLNCYFSSYCGELQRVLDHSENVTTSTLTVSCHLHTAIKVPVQAVEDIRAARGWGSHILRQSAHRWPQGCYPYAPDAFYPQESSWYSFLLEDASTPGP
jgi:hypothetical protein